MPNVLTLAILFFLGLALAAPVGAQQIAAKQMLRVSPVILKITLSPGKKEFYKIKVDNLLDSPLPIRATVSGFDASDEEYGIKISDSSNISPLVNWIKIESPEAIIPAKQAWEFETEISIPDKVPIGGYYAVIFFSPVLLDKQVGAKVGVVALANIGVGPQIKNQTEIVGFSFDKKLYQDSPVSTTIRIKNSSLNYFSIKPFLTIEPLFGQSKVFELEEKTILPGKVRRWQKSYDLGGLYHGIYKAQLAISLEKGDYIYSETYFFGFPLAKAVVVMLLAGFVIYSLLFRKRLFKALKLLIKG